MQPCRSLPWSRACRQCCRVCERAVGERRTTESVASIHKHHHWCGRIAHKIHTRAINTMENTVPPQPRRPILKNLKKEKKQNRSTWPGEHVQPRNRDSGPAPQCLFNLLSAYCDNISLSCSLQYRGPTPATRLKGRNHSCL